MKSKPGKAVVVLKNNKVVFKKCEDCTPTTAFRLASLTKLITAQAILMLEQQKKLSISDYAIQYISDLPKYAKKITIKQLLTHKSGIPNHETILYKTMKQGYEPTLRNVVPALKTRQRLLFKAGSQYKYSDTAYCLLAIIIERVSRKTYAKFLSMNIFKPLNMKNTAVLDETKPIILNRALGYRKSGKKWILYDYNQLNYVVGCEGIYSSINDLVKWSKILMENSFFKQIMTRKKNLIYQTGWWIGFNNIVLMDEKKGKILILLSNSDILRKEKDKLVYALNVLKRF